jgi:outer membrane protein assembly factor BamE (lipoprotein component of BamABCDE complex)
MTRVIARRAACAAGIAVLALVLALTAGCGAGAMLVLTLVGGAAAVSGEPQRLSTTQGTDFDEQRVPLIRSGVHTQSDVVGIMGNPQSKVFTNLGEEWSYRYFAPPTMLRAGLEKILTVRFRDGKVDDVRYTVSAL